MAADKPWCVYLLDCTGGGLYTGITPDIEKRFSAHQKGRAAFYTRLNPPRALLGQVWLASRREAAILERQVKKLTPDEKRRWLAHAPLTSPTAPTHLEALCDSLPLPTR